MNCHKAARLIPLILSGELALRRADSLKRHLATCTDCTRDYTGYQRSFGALRSLRTEEGPPDRWVGFNSRVRVAIENGSVERRGLMRLPLPRNLYLRVGAVAVCGIAAALVIAFAAGLFTPPAPLPGDSSGTTAGDSNHRIQDMPAIAGNIQNNQETSASENYVQDLGTEQFPYSLEEVTVTVGYWDEL